MKANIIKDIINKSEQSYPNYKFEYIDVPIDSAFNDVFIISDFTESQLSKDWTKIVNFIAIDFQSKLNTAFERWNIYIIFNSNEKISKELKSKIENDTFSSRKIVIDDGMPKEDVIKHYITKEDFTSKFIYNKRIITNSLHKENTNEPLEIFGPDLYLQKLIIEYKLAERIDNDTREALKVLVEKTK